MASGNAKRNANGLTDKQAEFVRLCISGMHRTAAYVQAFGPTKNATTLARKLALRSKIVTAIATETERKKRLDAEIERKVVEEASTAIAEKIVLTRMSIIDELWGNAMIGKAAVPVLDRKGKPTGEYQSTNLAASNRALELLGKELGMFKEAKEPDLFEKLSPEQVRALKALLDEWGVNRDNGADPSTGDGGPSSGPASGSPPRTIN